MMFMTGLPCVAETSAESTVSVKDDSLSVELKGVEITANRAGTKTPVAFTNITREEISRGNDGRDIPMLLEMVVQATGQSWQFITLVFAVIFGLGGAMISKRADKTNERVRVIQETKQQALRKAFLFFLKTEF